MGSFLRYFFNSDLNLNFIAKGGNKYEGKIIFMFHYYYFQRERERKKREAY